MSIARTWAVALTGIDGAIVEVEADVSDGKAGFELIGLADKALGEAALRVRSAITNLGIALPGPRLTVNLSPASLPKRGSAFDLAIAVGAIATSQPLARERLVNTVLLGELGLDGRLRPVAGVLPALLAAERAGFRHVVVPHANAGEASLVDGLDVLAAVSLAQVLATFGAEIDVPDYEPVEATVPPTTVAAAGDLSDVVGQADAVEAMTVAAAGGHHMAMSGPPGAGKTMLASRMPGILPRLDPTAGRAVASVMSLSGATVRTLPTEPPFVAPHHTATVAAMVGGGSGVIGPGAISRASEGLLFLDEALEFSASVLDALRESLESGSITIHRAGATATFPARFQMILATNPCPCGRFGVRGETCICPPSAVRKYAQRLSGPLRDRVDVDFSVRRVSAIGASPAPTSAAVLARVEEARARTAARLRDTPWTLNRDVASTATRDFPELRLPLDATAILDAALSRGALTLRGYHRVFRLAWTIADLACRDVPSRDDVAQALFLRRGVAA